MKQKYYDGAVKRAVHNVKNHSEKWAALRAHAVDARKNLAGALKAKGVKEFWQYGHLTDVILKEWSGMNVKEYLEFKGAKDELRDHMNSNELELLIYSEETAAGLLGKEHNRLNWEQLENIMISSGRMTKLKMTQMQFGLGGKEIITREGEEKKRIISKPIVVKKPRVILPRRRRIGKRIEDKQQLKIEF